MCPLYRKFFRQNFRFVHEKSVRLKEVSTLKGVPFREIPLYLDLYMSLV